MSIPKQDERTPGPEEPSTVPNPIGMVRECADWDAQCFPLTGGDVIAIMVRFGLVPLEDAKVAYIDVLENEHGFKNVTSAAYNATDDDKIPF